MPEDKRINEIEKAKELRRGLRQNDAIAEVDCGRMPVCCNNPRWVNHFGTDYCFCVNCMKKCWICKRKKFEDPDTMERGY